MKRLIFLFLVSFVLVCTPTQKAFATAMSNTTAWYDWSTFKIQVTYTPSGASTPITRDAVGANWSLVNNPPGTPGIDFFWYGTPTSPNANADNNIPETSGKLSRSGLVLGPGFQVSALVTNAQGIASVTQTGAIVSASGTALSDGIVTTSTSASAAIHRSANIFSNIDALFTFSVDAYIGQVISRDNVAESAWGQSSLNFFLTVNDNYVNLLDTDFIQINNVDGVNFSQSYHQQVEYFIPAFTGSTPSDAYRYIIGGSALARFRHQPPNLPLSPNRPPCSFLALA